MNSTVQWYALIVYVLFGRRLSIASQDRKFFLKAIMNAKCPGKKGQV